MKMTKADFDASTKAMIDLLEDPFFLCRDKDAQDAVTAIKEVRQTCLTSSIFVSIYIQFVLT